MHALRRGPVTTTISRETASSEGDEAALAPELLVRMHDIMVRARCLEERLIRMNKQGDGYFWIGGPGEEAFNVAARPARPQGAGPAVRLPAPALPLERHAARDGRRPGRRAPADEEHGDRPVLGRPQLLQPLLGAQVERRARSARPSRCSSRWRPAPRIANKRAGGKGITIVQGGDAGTAEGDFATCLVWCSRPGNELPLPDDRHQQPVGHLDAGVRAARREAHRRSRQGVRHQDRDDRRQRPRDRATAS